MIAWTMNDLARAWRWRPALYAGIGAAILAALSAAAWLQTSHWRNSVTLWEHSVDCQPDNDFALNSFADSLNAAGNTDEANKYYRLSLEKNPKYLTPWCNLAGNLYKHGKAAEALAVCDEALHFGPDDSKVHFLRAVALYGTGRADESIREFRIAIANNPNTENTRADLADMHSDLAEVLRTRPNQLDEARKECLAALELKPESSPAHRTLGNIMLAKGDLAAAAAEFRTALTFAPNDPLNVSASVNVVRQIVNDPHADSAQNTSALQLAQYLCEATQFKNIFALEALAGAYAATGDFAQADEALGKALQTPQGQLAGNAAVLQQRIQAYRAHQKVPIPPPSP